MFTFARNQCSTSPEYAIPTWAGYDVLFLLLIQLAVTLVIVLKMVGHGWYATGIGLISGLASLWLAFVSMMQVTGDWL